jgi:hypothetical protein
MRGSHSAADGQYANSIADRKIAISYSPDPPLHLLLADHHPVEEHPQSGQPLLHRGFGRLPELVFDKGRDADPLHLGQIHDVMLRAERGKLPDCFHVRAASFGVADMGAEEISHPLAGRGLPKCLSTKGLIKFSLYESFFSPSGFH